MFKASLTPLLLRLAEGVDSRPRVVYLSVCRIYRACKGTSVHVCPSAAECRRHEHLNIRDYSILCNTYFFGTLHDNSFKLIVSQNRAISAQSEDFAQLYTYLQRILKPLSPFLHLADVENM